MQELAAFSQGFAIGAGLVQGFVAMVFARFCKERTQWGLSWFVAVYAMSAVLNVGAPLFLNIPESAQLKSAAGLVSVVLGVFTMGALVAGLRTYVGRPQKPWLVVALVWAAYFGTAFLRPFFGDTGLAGTALTVVFFLYMAALLLGAEKREPGAGHGVAALLFGLYPPLVGMALLYGIDYVQLRAWASVPFAVAGLGIMSATMGRMRAELRELNGSLEGRVAERTQELREIVAGLESFNSMVSHDLRGPLGGINGLSGIAVEALKRGDHEQASRMLNMIHKETGQLAALVADLLMLGRVSHSEIHRINLPLNELLDDVLRSLDFSHGEGHSRAVHRGVLPGVQADRGLLRQALINLLGNALKFSRQAQAPRVLVSAREDEDGVQLSVKDNGIGFDGTRSEELFKPFQRLHNSASFEGSGVGLTIVRRIVERHGGRVWADSMPGAGATFHVWLPKVELLH